MENAFYIYIAWQPCFKMAATLAHKEHEEHGLLMTPFRRLEGLDPFSAEGANKYEGVPENICGNTFDRNEGSQ